MDLLPNSIEHVLSCYEDLQAGSWTMFETITFAGDVPFEFIRALVVSKEVVSALLDIDNTHFPVRFTYTNGLFGCTMVGLYFTIRHPVGAVRNLRTLEEMLMYISIRRMRDEDTQV